jgi:hypothetical protein
MNAMLLRREDRIAALMIVFTKFPGTYGVTFRSKVIFIIRQTAHLLPTPK